MLSVREKTIQLVEKILSADSNEDVLSLWSEVTSQLPIKEIVWAHGKVSRKLIQAIS
jgi:hypothetical protein